MKRTNLVLVSLLFSAFLYSCNKDETITDPGGGTTTTNVSGSIQNWPSQILILQAIATGSAPTMVGSDTVPATGQFDMNLSVPAPSSLASVSVIITDTNITVSDPDAFYAAFGNISVFNLSGTATGSITRKNFDSTTVTGSFIVNFIYLDRPCDITGTTMSIVGSDTASAEINLQLETGWNIFHTLQAEQRPNFSGIIIASGEPGGATWRFSANPSAHRLNNPFRF
jgi:hypothetical protein